MLEFEARRLVKTPDILLQDLGGEAVLLNLSNGQYYGLDENSYLMYRTLLSSDTIIAAYDALAKQYEVDPEKLKSDLYGFIRHLLDNGLLTYADDKPR
jgi:hypothetical protein